jgi:hypothetical protein
VKLLYSVSFRDFLQLNLSDFDSEKPGGDQALEMLDSVETEDSKEKWELWNQKLKGKLPDHSGKRGKDEKLCLKAILFTSREESAKKRAKGTKLR